MVTHGDKQMTSSKRKALVRQLLKTPIREERRSLTRDLNLSKGEKERVGIELIHHPDFRKNVLIEIANLRDDGCGHLRRSRWFALYHYESDEAFLKLRDELRQVWSPDTPSKEKQVIIDSWLREPPGWFKKEFPQHVPKTVEGTTSTGQSLSLQIASPEAKPYVPLMLLWSSALVPDPLNPRPAVALSVVENKARLALCANPECPARYFLAKRKGQKYCEPGECTRYAQRRYSLKYWRNKGKDRRALRNRTKKARKLTFKNSKLKKARKK